MTTTAAVVTVQRRRAASTLNVHPTRGLVALTVALVLASGSLARGAELVEAIVVRVNERIVTTRDFARRVQERSAEVGKPVAVEDYPKIVDELADDLCLLERASELKIEVDESEVDAAVKELREQNQVADDAAFEQTLKSMGMTLTQLRTRLRDTMVINRLLSREIGPLPVTDAELQHRYERDKEQFRVPEGVRLQHAIFAIDSDDTDGKRAVAAAQRLVAATRSGQDFAKLVEQQVSEGSARGGDLGVVRLPDLRQDLADVVAKLKPGEVSDPVQTPSGIHVFKLVERIPASYKPYAEVSGELRERELAERYRSRMTGVVDGLKKRYVVETHPELVVATQR